MLFDCRREVKPGDCAVGPGSFAQPVERGIARRELQAYLRTGICLAEKERAAGNNYDDAGTFPGKNFPKRLEPWLRGVTNRKPTLVANQLLVFVEHFLPDAVAFTVLKNRVADEREKRDED